MLPKLKDFSKYIGLGVAVKQLGQPIRKYKIDEIMVKYDQNGRHVDSVHLEGAGWQTSFLNRLPFKPEECFRNKGECARYYSHEELVHRKEKIKILEDRLENAEKEAESINRQLKDEWKKYSDMLVKNNHAKWSGEDGKGGKDDGQPSCGEMSASPMRGERSSYDSEY